MDSHPGGYRRGNWDRENDTQAVKPRCQWHWPCYWSGNDCNRCDNRNWHVYYSDSYLLCTERKRSSVHYSRSKVNDLDPGVKTNDRVAAADSWGRYDFLFYHCSKDTCWHADTTTAPTRPLRSLRVRWIYWTGLLLLPRQDLARRHSGVQAVIQWFVYWELFNRFFCSTVLI